MAEEAMRTGKQAARPMRFLPRKLAARLNDQHMPATSTFKRVLDELLLRPIRRRRLRRSLSVSRKLLLPGMTVLVPVRNRAGIRLANLLASLEQQSACRDMRVLVIDYGSAEDEAREIARLAAASGAGLVRIEADEWNKAAALNAGLRRVLTKFVLAVDVDLLFEPRYVERSLSLLRDDPRRIVVSAMRDLPDIELETVSRQSFGELGMQARNRFDAKYHPSIVAVHRLAIADIGGYDEEYRGWGVEDVDLFTRLRNAGLDPVDAGRETGYLHQWHPKYDGLAEANVGEIVGANQLRFRSKLAARKPGPRKAIVTAAGPRMRGLLERYALPTFWHFADRFGYDVLPSFLDDDGQSDDRRAANGARWAKLPLLREAAESYDIVVWFDADVMIRRFDDDIASHLAPEKFQAFVLEQVPQDRRVNPNTGVWAMRGGSRTIRFLKAVEQAGQQRGPWADQAAVMRVLGWDRGGALYHDASPGRGSAFLRGTGWLPPSWNQLHSVPGENAAGVHAMPRVDEPHALHFAGMGIDEREMRMRRALEHLMADTAAGFATPRMELDAT